VSYCFLFRAVVNDHRGEAARCRYSEIADLYRLLTGLRAGGASVSIRVLVDG
jgi:hypothetical protein